ncbi:uncharacterized protein PV09_01898 [Verruconis gallopava]|uniref:AAA+ ATPase domain-containing protein n=1 Tax=Verruconis gallopava TaxID=253628 RepID=A0A0D2AJF0_9PEZI|nr:uncharacterized protein PV09_01898 [Verruconis gallopava]KIW07003.1 hypothetical protein PV09_01898 [Verruconis gallopava]
MAEINNGHDSDETPYETNQTSATSTKSDDEVELLTGSVCEIKSLVEKPKGGEMEVIEKDKYDSTLEKKPFEQYALVTKRILDEEGKLKIRTLQINSPQLLNALKDVVEYYPSESLDFTNQVSYDSPYELLYHHRSQLESYKENQNDEMTSEHIDLLLHFLASEAGDKGKDAEKALASGLVTFENAWMAYKPGELIFTSSYGQDRLYILNQTGYHKDNCRGRYFQLSCNFSSCDGENVGTAQTNLVIWEKDDFVGKTASKITSLSAIPLKYLDEDQQELIKAKLTERGKRYLEIRGVKSWEYDGLYLYLKTPPYDFYDERSNYDGKWLPRTCTERVVLDPKTFIEEMRDQKDVSAAMGTSDCCRLSNCDSNQYQSLEADPMLCPPYVYGFSLESKEWCKYFVDNLSPVVWQENAMDALILPNAQRRLIRSLVTSHRYPDHARDEASLKGKGLIMLLHGTPGSGKTLTAELTAEQTKRPLLKLSTGELGSWEERLSHELKKLLTYASIWKAVVLIDEADVFLEARRSGSDSAFNSNNMVAIFLKQLEYFQGILFLTSNRVGVFDQAIRSRLHLAMQYHAPDESRRALLWRQKLSQLQEVDISFDMEDAIKTLSKPAMNGREINNAVNTAKTLATAENNGKMRLEDLDTVVQVWQEFQSSMEQLDV